MKSMIPNMTFGRLGNILASQFNIILKNFTPMACIYFTQKDLYIWFLITGLRFDAATQIGNNEFLKTIVQQSKEQARVR